MKTDNIFNKITKNYKIHFIGVGGISMISLAEIFINKGYFVSGSDSNYSEDIKKLEKTGLKFLGANSAQNITDADIIVYTAAVKPGNPEYDAAVLSGKPMLVRAEVLGYIMSFYKNSIAICGTHGKTTVTSMISYIFEKLLFDPTILVGAHLDLIGGTMKHGKSDYFIAEACEYKRSFLEFYPFCEVVLNVEPDHMDYYKDADDYHSAYDSFLNNLNPDGFAVINSDDADLLKICENHKNIKTITFSINSPAEIKAENITADKSGTHFDVYINRKKNCRVSVPVFGKHNISNVLAAIACAYGFGITVSDAAGALSEFSGADRRFEYRGKTSSGADVYDDYAHHPTEIKATIDILSMLPHASSICIYQPHTYSRTKAFFDEFSTAFTGVDTLIFADIYAARESDDGTVSSKMLAESARKNGINALYLGDFDAIVEYVNKISKENDVVIVMGAGDIINMTPSLIF